MIAIRIFNLTLENKLKQSIKEMMSSLVENEVFEKLEPEEQKEAIEEVTRLIEHSFPSIMREIKLELDRELHEFQAKAKQRFPGH